MKSRKSKIILLSSVGIIVLIVAGYWFLGVLAKAKFGEIPPDSATTTNMYVLKRRILHFAKLNNRLPVSLNEVPELEGFYNENTDYWGWDIKMEINNSEVTLISYGKDNQPGGTGENLDLIAIFDAKTPSGSWVDENNEGYPFWKMPPKIREYN